MFIGPKQIQTAEPAPEKYNGTIDQMVVTYDDGTKETMSALLYNASVTPEATDLTTLRDNRDTQIVKAILDLLLTWGAPLADINFITSSIALSVNASIDAATTKLWGKEEADLNMIEIDTMLKGVTLSDVIPPKTDAGNSDTAQA